MADWKSVVFGANVADWKRVAFGANVEGVKAAAASKTRLPTSKSAVADIGKTVVVCPMIVCDCRIRMKIVGIGHSGNEQGTVHCVAQSAVVALSNEFLGVGMRAVAGGRAVGNVVPPTEGVTGLEERSYYIDPQRNSCIVEQAYMRHDAGQLADPNNTISIEVR